jgi:acyl-coenzyme A synthetase/AMP-(fatty) acid ligase
MEIAQPRSNVEDRPMMSFYHILREHADRQPDHPALIYRGNTASYAELLAKVESYADRIEARCSDQYIPLFLPKTIECVVLMFASLAAGRSFVCVNRKFRGPQLQFVAHYTGAARWFTDHAGLVTIHSSPQSDELSETIRWFVVGKASDLSSPEWFHKYDILNWDHVQNVDMRSENHDPGCCIFTSGSTGSPKGVRISEQDLVGRATSECRCFGLETADVLLSVLPFSFDVGLNQLLAGVCAGSTIVLSDSWLPQDLLNVVQAHEVSGISAVPALWQSMINTGMHFDTTEAHSSLRFLTISGGDLSIEYLDRMERLAPGVGILKTYGQTEAFRTTVLQPHQYSANKRSVGQAFEGARMYIVDDNGRQCGPYEIGEVVHTGLGVMEGYLSGSDDNKRRRNPFRDHRDPSEWAIFTGDLGYVDDAGFLFLHGRRDTMVKIDGNRVYPDEVTRQILSIPRVIEATVIGVPADGEYRLIAFICHGEGPRRQPWPK